MRSLKKLYIVPKGKLYFALVQIKFGDVLRVILVNYGPSISVMPTELK
jgi:hypothetical protein